MTISFTTENIKFQLADKQNIKRWIKEICTRDNKAITVITFKSEKINNDCIDYSYNVVLEGEFSKIQKNIEN